mmetsp:Transcript_21729/g.67363  ORF Transcript_21729/g.67363 Transcript_21729/m.67363 type:complete len:205 (-) Transcript_21729:127-741(-)
MRWVIERSRSFESAKQPSKSTAIEPLSTSARTTASPLDTSPSSADVRARPCASQSAAEHVSGALPKHRGNSPAPAGSAGGQRVVRKQAAKPSSGRAPSALTHSSRGSSRCCGQPRANRTPSFGPWIRGIVSSLKEKLKPAHVSSRVHWTKAFSRQHLPSGHSSGGPASGSADGGASTAAARGSVSFSRKHTFVRQTKVLWIADG